VGRGERYRIPRPTFTGRAKRAKKYKKKKRAGNGGESGCPNRRGPQEWRTQGGNPANLQREGGETKEGGQTQNQNQTQQR